MIRDRAATMAQHYEDKRSYMCLDGREVLYGKDWEARKYMVWCRQNRRCCYWGCFNEISDIHHIIKRSKVRDDRLNNLEGLCRRHHELRHPEKQPQWTKREVVKDPVTQETLIRYSKGKRSADL